MTKPKMVRTAREKEIIALMEHASQKTLVIWAADCAERVLPIFEHHFLEDRRPRDAIAAARAWAGGQLRVSQVRFFALASHAAARDAAGQEAAQAAARAAGHAVATAHVPRHALGAVLYGLAAIRDSSPSSEVSQLIDQENVWQLNHLKDLAEGTV